MSVIEITRGARDRRPRRDGHGASVDRYEDVLARAMALAPALRSERKAFEAIPAVEDPPSLSPAVRPGVSAVAMVSAAGGASLLVPTTSILVTGLGVAFGIGAAAFGDRLGAALRAMRGRGAWPRQVALVPAVLMRAAEVALLVVSAWLVTTSALAGLGVVMLAAVAVIVGYATRVGDAESEARAAARADARRKLEVTEHAVLGAIAALHEAHAANLARITTEIGRSAGKRVHASPASADRFPEAGET